MHTWLRLRSWYARVAPLFLAVSVLLPVVAALGFVNAGRTAAVRARDPAELQRVLWSGRPPLTPAERAVLESIPRAAIATYATALLLVVATRGVRNLRARRGGVIRVGYPNGRRVEIAPGLTVLEASRIAGIPHASVCGGRGRCSTCRVRVRAQAGALPPPPRASSRCSRRVGLPPDVRLACQLRPRGDVAVAPLLPSPCRRRRRCARCPKATSRRSPSSSPTFAASRASRSAGCPTTSSSSSIAISTRSAARSSARRHRQPVHRRRRHGAFRRQSSAGEGSRAALRAAGDMVAAVAELSRTLGEDLPVPLRIGIGIHTGPAVVGRMGYADGVYLTAVGDTVHVAKRLEELTKQYACRARHLRDPGHARRVRRRPLSAPRADRPQPDRAAGRLGDRGRPGRRAGAGSRHPGPLEPAQTPHEAAARRRLASRARRGPLVGLVSRHAGLRRRSFSRPRLPTTSPSSGTVPPSSC